MRGGPACATAAGWPAHIDAARARRLGLLPDDSFDAIIGEYLELARVSS